MTDAHNPAGLPRPVSSDVALEIAATVEKGIATGHDWPNTQDELDRINAARFIRTLVAERDALAGRVRELEAEVLDQCRLNGMGAERESALMGRVRELEAAFSKLIDYASGQLCTHEETYRGGAIWEICSMCGAKWADDEGGKPEWVEPKQIIAARAALTTPESKP